MSETNNDLSNFLLATIIIAPAWPAAIAAGITYWIISALRLSAPIIGGVMVLSVIPFFVNWELMSYLIGWVTLCFDLQNPFYPAEVTWAKVITTSILVGLLGGCLLHLFLGEKRHHKKTSNKKTIMDDIAKWITEKKYQYTQPNGVFLGVDSDLKAVIIQDSEVNQHTLIIGTTGSGKTTTLKNFIQHGLKNDFSIVLVDGKGEWGYAQEIKTMAEMHGREGKLFSLNHPDESCHYNPLAVGNPTELKDRLVACYEWTEPHYFLGASRYLQLAIQVLRATGQTIDLPMLVQSLPRIEAIARQVGAPNDILTGLAEIDEKTRAGITSRLALLTESAIGDLLENHNGQEINLLHTIRNGGVAMFSLDKLAYPEFARQLGVMIVNDLKACAARCGYRKTLLVFDEFGTFASPQVVDLVNASRSFGFCVVMATQSLADLDRIDSTLRRQVVANVNTVIIQRQNDAQDAEVLAATIGTQDTILVTQQLKNDIETELGSAREVKEFLVHPDSIKRLKTGEAIILRKYPEFRVHHVWRIRNA